jgi:aerobic carbon-monoxide dehydrogenase medium subunit
MKPVAFEFERPSAVDEATRLLAEEGAVVKAVAGSQSLGPMLNLRLAQPDLLVDITGIEELAAVSDSRDHLLLGACVTHANIEDGRVPDVTKGLLPHVAGRIAYRAVRNRGTIGGSLAHADPAADWISVLPALGADIAVTSQRGKRYIAAANFMQSSFTTELRQDELITAVRIPKCSSGARWGFCKINQKVGEFAHAIGVIFHDPADGRFRAVLGAVESRPIVVEDARVLFGDRFNEKLGDRLDETKGFALLDDRGVSDGYSRKLLLVALKRAAMQAFAS